MKTIYTILILLLWKSISGQELPKKEGCIEVKKMSHYFIPNKRGDQTKRISNKANRPYQLLYLDTLGNVIEKIGYGKHHNSDLRLLDFVEQYEYADGKRIKTMKYISDYDNNISVSDKIIYLYNAKNQLIQKKVLHGKNDSLLSQINFEYDSIENSTITFFNTMHYHKKIFDAQSRLLSWQQIYDNKLRWEWKYSYTDTSRTGEFKTFYDDNDNYTKKEIKRYREGRLAELEEKYTSQDGLAHKTVLHYNTSGLIVKMDYYEDYSDQKNYQRKISTEINTKFCRPLSPEIIRKINELIFEE